MGTLMNNTLAGNPLTVAQLAVSHPGALAVFTKYDIDYCCGGHRSIEDACRRKGLDPELIKKEIFSSQEQPTETIRPQQWSSTFLIDYIIENHHEYIKNAIPEILQFLDKVCDAHGSDNDELLSIREIFIDLSDELTDHLGKEELILFPAIKRLESQSHDDHPLQQTIQAPLQAMEFEHESAGDAIKQIRTLSNNYSPPEYACPTFKITYKKLQEFDNDLMKHVHLENNILFARLRH